MDKIGLVTITFNSSNVLEEFLDCVFTQTYENFILFVIDNDSNDNTINILEKIQDRRIVIIKNTKNVGVAKANNQGIKEAIIKKCDQILILNNDIRFEPNMIKELLVTQKNNDCSLVTPKIMYNDNPNWIWYSGGSFLKSKGFLPYHRGIKELDKGQYDKIEKVEYAPTCCLLVKKKVFKEIGFMDEKYFVYFDDTDFAYRIWKNSIHEIFYCPNVKVYHKVGSLTKSFFKEKEKVYRGKFFIEQNIKNHIYFLRKIGGIYGYIFIIWLFFKNNIWFFSNRYIKKDISNFLLINKSYFSGLFL